MLPKLRKWLNGNFTCKTCGQQYHTMSFGYGQAICPKCYNGEQQFLFHDNTYWLNRITTTLLNQRTKTTKQKSYKITPTRPTPSAPKIEAQLN